MSKLPKHIEERFDKYINEVRDKDYDFRYGVMPHRIEHLKSFIATILNEERERIIKTIKDLRKTKGTEDFANFKLPNDDIWLSAKPVQPNIKRLVYNSALDSVINLIKEDK